MGGGTDALKKKVPPPPAMPYHRRSSSSLELPHPTPRTCSTTTPNIRDGKVSCFDGRESPAAAGCPFGSNAAPSAVGIPMP
uniref:Uncharacterized protein n=1 Tax=Aegilops tauschii TaxID=37682 RepID=M8CC89_AEGTA